MTTVSCSNGLREQDLKVSFWGMASCCAAASVSPLAVLPAGLQERQDAWCSPFPAVTLVLGL